MDTGIQPWTRKPDSSFLSFPSGQPRAPTPTPVPILVRRPKRWAIDSAQRGGGRASSCSALRSAAATTAHYCCCMSSRMRLTDMSSVSILTTFASLPSVAIAVAVARLVYPPIFPRSHHLSSSRCASSTPCRTTTRRLARLPSALAHRLGSAQASETSPCPRSTLSRTATMTMLSLQRRRKRLARYLHPPLPRSLLLRRTTTFFRRSFGCNRSTSCGMR